MMPRSHHSPRPAPSRHPPMVSDCAPLSGSVREVLRGPHAAAGNAGSSRPAQAGAPCVADGEDSCSRPGRHAGVRALRPGGRARWLSAGWARLQAPVIAVAAVYVSLSFVFLRQAFCSQGCYIQGTNEINEVILLSFEQKHPLNLWLFPFTDWGQPYAGYPGVQPLSLLMSVTSLSPSTVIWGLYLLSFTIAGLGTFLVLRAVQCGVLPSFAGSLLYTLQAEVPQFFEGHVSAMITVALGPLFFYFAYRFFSEPTYQSGILLSLTSYILLSIGDLGVDYKYALFAAPMVCILIVVYPWNARKVRRHLHAIVSTGVLLVALMTPWLLAWGVGARPEYSTAITATQLSFQQVSSVPLPLGLVGFVADNSFTYYHLGSYTYALGDLRYSALFFLFPIASGASVLTLKSWKITAFYGSGLLALAFSTGGLYPALSDVNSFIWYNVPLVADDPAVFRWVIYSVLVNSFVIAIGLDRIGALALRWIETQYHRIRRALQEIRSSGTFGLSSKRVSRPRMEHQFTNRETIYFHRHRRSVTTACLAVFIVAAGIAQNLEVFATPPSAYEIPPSYTEGFGYVASHHPSGGILSVPFGNIYERTPWGGISGSSQLAVGTQLGSDLVIGEAGTPESLAMDQFIGGGLAYGLTNNLSKFLRGTNVQYVVGTNYSDWSYASDPIYNPESSYLGLLAQVGLEGPVFRGGVQDVYAVPGNVGNISFSTKYYLYFGGNELLYEIMNQPWYNGTEPLLNLSQFTDAQSSGILAHAAGLIVDPGYGPISHSVIATAAKYSVPIVSLYGATNLPGGDGLRVSEPWSASNALSFTSINASTPITFQPPITPGIRSVGLDFASQARVRCTSPSYISITSTGTGAETSQLVGGQLAGSLPYWNSTIVSPGINNQGTYTYNGSTSFITKGDIHEILWNFSSNNQTFQYLNFDLHNLSGIDGFLFNVSSTRSYNFMMQSLFDDTYETFPAQLVGINNGTGTSTYSIDFNLGFGPGSSQFSKFRGNITRFVLGLPSTGNQDSLELSNFTGFLSSTDGFTDTSLTRLPLAFTANFSVSAPPTCLFDTVSLVAGNDLILQAKGAQANSSAPQESDGTTELSTPPLGWGVLMLSEVYSPLFVLSGNYTVVDHMVVNLGLNGWLVDLTDSGSITVTCEGNNALVLGTQIEALLISGWVLATCFLVCWRRRRVQYSARMSLSSG